MSKTPGLQFSCDVCNASKEENHGRWRVMFNISLMQIPGFAIYDWNDALATMADAAHACGDRCAHTLLERAMALSAARKSLGVPA
jgi:hypothetical protein